jgi:glutathione peroxidase
MNEEFYKLSALTPSGKTIDFEQYRGKTVLIVNTATRCGLRGQFDELEALYQKYKDQGLVVLGFPSNQFSNQEPETNDSVEHACLINHGVTFQLTQKIDVNGPNEDPVFTYLKSKKGTLFGKSIKWNFAKFLINKEGKVVKRFAPTTKPSSFDSLVAQELKK